MNRRYTDTENVTESLETIVEMAEPGDSGRLTILDAGQARVVAATLESLRARNLPGNEFDTIDDSICTIAWEKVELGRAETTNFELHFHEKVVESAFELRPAGHLAIDAQQAVNPLALGPKLKEALSPLVEKYDAMFTFNEVSAASIANGGHYTDFEFEYSIDGVSSPFEGVGHL